MIKLEDVKKGDFVLMSKLISYDWDNRVLVWLPIEVLRVTKTLIVASEGRFYKSHGGLAEKRERYSRAHRASIIVYDIMNDDTIKYDTIKRKMNDIKKIEDSINELKKNDIAKLFFNDNRNEIGILEEINIKLQEIATLLKSNKEGEK